VIANPPYGERLEAGPVFEELAAAIERWREQRITLLLPEDAELVGLTRRSAQELPLFNGPLRCILATWDPA